MIFNSNFNNLLKVPVFTILGIKNGKLKLENFELNQKLLSIVDYACYEHIEPDIFFCHEPFCQSSVYVITLYLAYN